MKYWDEKEKGMEIVMKKTPIPSVKAWKMGLFNPTIHISKILSTVEEGTELNQQ